MPSMREKLHQHHGKGRSANVIHHRSTENESKMQQPIQEDPDTGQMITRIMAPLSYNILMG
jgi:hypothetical protein